MKKVTKGDTVKVHYTGKLADGSVFDTSRERDPLQIKLGENQVIPGLENAVIGMETGKKKTAVIMADDAYGQFRDDLIVTMPFADLPDDLNPKVDEFIKISHKDGRELFVKVLAVDDKNITFDGNHPLAGKDLTFEIEIVEIE